jgi:outer membrane receptor protein involved in Fe transport
MAARDLTRAALLAAAGALFMETPALAQDTSGLLEVMEDNVVSGASRSEEQASNAPAFSSTITAEQLRRFGMRRLDEAINFLTVGMFAQDDMSVARLGAQGVALTHDNNNHVLIVLDGMVMNEQAGGAAYLHDVPLDAIDHVEVILGPGSVLYGSQAMFGVVNVVTKRAESGSDSAETRLTIGAMPPFNTNGGLNSTSLSSMGTDVTASGRAALTFPVLGRELALASFVDYSSFRGPTFSFAPEQLATRFDGSPAFDTGPHGIPGSWGGPIQNQWHHRTVGALVRVDYGDLTSTVRVAGTQLASPQMDAYDSAVGAAYDDPRNMNTYGTVLANLQYQTRLGARVSGMARAYFGYSDTLNNRFVLTHDLPTIGEPLGIVDPVECPQGPVGPCVKTSHFLSRWFGSELQGTFDWNGDGAYVTMGGIDARFATNAYEFVTYDALTGKSYGSDPAYTRWTGGGSLEAGEGRVGAYVQNVLRPWKRVTFNLGLRADYDSQVAAQYLPKAVSPRAAFIWAPTTELTLKTSYSQAFRAPSFLELNEVEGRLLPNPNGLEPETVYSVEQSASLRLGAHSLAIGAFYSEWQNLIELATIQAQAPVVSEYQNVSSIQNFGVNASYSGSILDRVQLGLNVTVASPSRQPTAEERQIAIISSAGEGSIGPSLGGSIPVTAAPNVFGNARASYLFHDTADTAVSLAARFFGQQNADRAYIGGAPSNLSPTPTAPSQLELRGTLTGNVPGLAACHYTVGVDVETLGTKQPYVVGPNQGVPSYLSTTGVTSWQLAPLIPFTAFVGLDVSLERRDKAHAPNPSLTGPPQSAVVEKPPGRVTW